MLKIQNSILCSCLETLWFDGNMNANTIVLYCRLATLLLLSRSYGAHFCIIKNNIVPDYIYRYTYSDAVSQGVDKIGLLLITDQFKTILDTLMSSAKKQKSNIHENTR